MDSEKIYITITTTIAGLFFGFIAGQASDFFKRREQRKQVLSRVLSQLLEIRESFLATTYIVNRLTSELVLPFECYDEIISNLPDGILWDSSISERYRATLHELSAHLPILAFSLRSKDSIGTFSTGNIIKFGETEETFEFTKKIFLTAESSLLPTLNETIIAIAGYVGKKQLKWVKTYLKTNTGSDEDLHLQITSIIKAASESLELLKEKSNQKEQPLESAP